MPCDNWEFYDRNRDQFTTLPTQFSPTDSQPNLLQTRVITVTEEHV